MKSESSSKKTMVDTSKKTVKKNSKIKNVTITKFKDLEGQFLHVKVGDAISPATIDQISDIQKKIEDLFEKNNVNCLAFVTHHAVSIDIVEKES